MARFVLRGGLASSALRDGDLLRDFVRVVLPYHVTMLDNSHREYEIAQDDVPFFLLNLKGSRIMEITLSTGAIMHVLSQSGPLYATPTDHGTSVAMTLYTSEDS